MILHAREDHIQPIYDLIQSVELDSSVFLKCNDIEKIRERLKYSYVYVDNRIDKNILGCILIDYKYFNNSKEKVFVITSIVSKKRGVASELLRYALIYPEFKPHKLDFYCTISPNNIKSINLFKKYGFKKVNDITFMGYQREVYSKCK